ncbi:hypothetical protein OY11_24080 [Salmonella enterica]|nr:hypothetical protein [Salmonella enterica]
MQIEVAEKGHGEPQAHEQGGKMTHLWMMSQTMMSGMISKMILITTSWSKMSNGHQTQILINCLKILRRGSNE